MRTLSEKAVLFLVCFLFVLTTRAQDSMISGRVTDEVTTEPLPFVNIGLKDQPVGTYSDENGNFELALPHGTHVVLFSYVGYSTIEKTISVNGKKAILNVTLRNVSKELNTVVVSASRYAQRIQESITSISVLKPGMIENTNAQSIDQAVDQVPGVTIVNEEPQIRGGSGFSSGMGSRVMVMVDEIPVLRGDAGRPVWSFLPVDDIEQIEVLKGASSVIHGSSAINGAINVRTAWPGEQASTKLTGVIGIYSKPTRRYATPWAGMNPLQYALNLSHMQRLKDNVDLGVGFGVYNDQGYIGSVPAEAKLPDSVLNTGEYDRRIKFNFNTRVRSKKIEGLSYGLNGNFLYTKNAKAFFWYDNDTNLYRPFVNAMSNFTEFIYYLDPFIKYFGK
ncbi:MAG TPA: carboxypeptidase-like regulatory domain-containing protein, partial [Bacteroidales bacterium]|nr:carboxypeptidase-like regulatory domain-containing protein [Bacteroidales bacterium]